MSECRVCGGDDGYEGPVGPGGYTCRACHEDMLNSPWAFDEDVELGEGMVCDICGAPTNTSTFSMGGDEAIPICVACLFGTEEDDGEDDFDDLADNDWCAHCDAPAEVTKYLSEDHHLSGYGVALCAQCAEEATGDAWV